MLTARAASAGQEHGSDMPIFKTSPRLRLGEGKREGCRRGPVVCNLHMRSKDFAGDSSVEPKGSVPGKVECWKAWLGNSWAQIPMAAAGLSSSWILPSCSLKSAVFLTPTVFLVFQCQL